VNKGRFFARLELYASN